MSARETIQARRKRLSVLPRACEACKVRKIRCDRATPCSNCTSSGIVCQISSAPSEVQPKLDRVSQLERRIETLETRLQAVEQHQAPAIELAVHDSRNFSPTIPNQDSSGGYVGNSSFTNEVFEASETARKATPAVPGFGPSLGRLSDLLQSSNNVDDHHLASSGDVIASTSTPTIPVPFELTAAILRRMKERTPVFCYGYFLNDISMIEDLFQRAYSFTSTTKTGLTASVLGILYVIMKEFIATSDPLCQQYDLSGHIKTCEQMFKVEISKYEVLAVPTFENVLALAFGAFKAQEDSKPFLFSTLISAAANHCRSLGYHRRKSRQATRQYGYSSENACRLFWSVYISDKTLSLLLGRAANLQDLDIDIPYPKLSTDAARRPWDENFIMAIQMAEIQGQVYDRLYSPAALKTPQDIRSRNIDDLAKFMSSWRDKQSKIDAARVAYPEIWASSRQHWDVNYYSTLTTLLRAPVTSETGSTISSQCFHAARLSLESHMSCFSAWHTSGSLSSKDYANWVLHYSSFTCYVVIFLHSISAASMADVNLLENVVDTLSYVRETSKHSERLYKICATLADLAKQLVKSDNVSLGAYNSDSDTLQFLEGTQSPLFEPQTLRNWLPPNGTNFLEDWENYDMGAVLTDWANGDSTTLDLELDT